LFIYSEDFDMNYISTWLSHLRPMQMLMSILLSAILVFGSGCTAPDSKSAMDKGTVQLDKIERNTERAIESPATSLKTIEERSKGALNEVQGSADRNKMNRSNDTMPPVVKRAEKAIDNMKKS
jgi:hypothetical protein